MNFTPDTAKRRPGKLAQATAIPTLPSPAAYTPNEITTSLIHVKLAAARPWARP